MFPDWFAPGMSRRPFVTFLFLIRCTGTQGYWNSEFYKTFNPTSGIDIDALWIDMNEASNFCAYPCTDPLEWAKTGWPGDPPRPPYLRLSSPYAVPGFPKDFQPKCIAYVNFYVHAETYNGENIIVFGESPSLGHGIPAGAPQMGAPNYPTWSATIQFPANTKIKYSYLRFEVGNTYIHENITRILTTGDCGSYKSTNDTISTAPGTSSSKVRSLPEVLFEQSGPIESVEKRQSGSMLGLPNRNLVDPPYM